MERRYLMKPETHSLLPAHRLLRELTVPLLPAVSGN